ncbi:autotransporter outer membrane beta-barrel domain-containing protein [Methylophilaceae bacterium]|nr:autotransporter outer membrane beta-barrel domain-containing protein [Methylophilaceae bacterium]
MKKKLLALATTLLLPNISYADVCPTGTSTAPAAGCTISTDNTTYTLTGNMEPASGVDGFEFLFDSDGNTLSLTGNITTTGTLAHALYLYVSDDNIITLNGDLSVSGAASRGMYFQASKNNDITMNGKIDLDSTAQFGIFIYGSDDNAVKINGNITTVGIGDYGLYFSLADNNNVTLNANITTSDNAAHGVKIGSSSNGNTFTNLGTITTTGLDSYNIYADSEWDPFLGDPSYFRLDTLNNRQNNLTHYGRVPTNYNIIIRGDADYGKTTFSGVSGTMAFGIDLTNSGTGIGDKTYQDVLTGIAASGVLTATTGTSDGTSWSLDHDGTNWDLTISGALSGSYVASSAPSTASTRSSIQSASYGIASQFAGYAMSTNYANLNTYDCGLFDQDGGCFSVGGRYSDVNGNNNTDSSSSALVAVGGFKINDNLRVAGFIDQQANSSTPNGITLDNKGPMVGMSLVWNQHPDHLGFRVKVANAYQSKDLSITRTATGDAEAGRGDTEIEVQSYVAEVSYQFSDGVKTAYRPYVALRRAIIQQDGYTETDVDNPLTFNTLEDKSTTVIMGMKAKYKLSNQVTLNGALGVEHDVDNDIDKLQATSSTITGLTAVDINSSINKTRPVATLGATYHISPNQTLSAQTQYQELAYTSTSAKTAYVNYTVGF